MLDMVTAYVLPVAFLALSPLIGGLLMGVDRKVTARMQNRVGPPIVQPFYDVVKLWGKKPFITGAFQPVLAFGYLGFAFLALAILAFGMDVLLTIFTVAIADICLIAAGYNSKSPFSYLGAKRELFSMIAYEPILIMIAISIYLVTGSFLLGGVYSLELPLAVLLPGAFVAMAFVLIVELKKSPYDVSASMHAHQELVRGVFTEFSGYTMAVVEVGHWTKMVLILSFVALFWAPNLLIGAGLAFIFFFAAITIDNSYPRLTWQRMIRTVWVAGFALILLNIAGLIVFGVI